MSHPELKTLYLKIGEKLFMDILREFYRRMSTDLMIGFFFSGKDPNTIAEKQGQFMKAAMGVLPEYPDQEYAGQNYLGQKYPGKTPSSAHLALPPIRDGHFNRRVELLTQTLASFRLDAEDIRIWTGFEKAFKTVVVQS